jgi:hypothetical protein
VATAEELLRAAAMGRVGIDRRLVRSILESPDAAAAVVRFAGEPRKDHRLEIDPLLVDLFRHFRPDEALNFYIDAIRRTPSDAPDELVEAILPFGEKAIDPLVALYEELGEEQGADVAFLLAGLHIRDPRILAVLLDRLEYDTADGAFALGLYGDPAARPALESVLAEIPEADQELRREVMHALESLEVAVPEYEADAFDLLAEYPEFELPSFEVLPESELLELLATGDEKVRAGAAYSFFNGELSAKARAALLNAAKSDTDTMVRARAWESLADTTDDASIRDSMMAVLNDESKPIEERGGAAVGLYGVGDRPEVQRGIEALYALGGKARVKALEAMWRSLYEPYAAFFPAHLDETEVPILREALRGAGYFQLTRCIDKIAKFLDRDEPYDKLREDALFAYALAMPGETTRGRARGMLRKIESISPLTSFETELVEFALDERLRLHGLAPVFSAAQEEEVPEPAPAIAPPAPQKIGRNDPCPCGSGKKYKKCCGQ